MSDRARRGLTAAIAVAAAAAAFVAAGPRCNLFINWDNAGYLAGFASGSDGWSTPPWNSHFAIGQLYLAACWLARALGGTYIDGFRLANAIAVGIAAALLYRSAARIAGSAAVAVAVVAAFVTAWGLVVLVATLEDNVLFVPACVGVVALALDRVDDWRLRDSIVAGALAAVGRLISYQAGIYVVVPLIVIVCFGGRRRVGARAAAAGVLVATFFATIVAWTLFVWATTRGNSLRELLRLALFSRPVPSYFPHSADGWWTLVADWRGSLRHLGVGLAAELGPLERYRRWTAAYEVDAGAVFFAGTLLFAAASIVAARGTRAGRRLCVVALTLVAFTVVTSLYHDIDFDKYKRYDYLPLVGAFALACVVELAQATAWRRRAQLAMVALLVGVGVAEVRHDVVSIRDFRAAIGDWVKPGWAGRDGTSWYGWFVKLRAQHPACMYVLALDDVREGRYGYEIEAAMWSELPDHRVVPTPPDVRFWHHKLKFVDGKAALDALPACAWWSPAADKARAAAK